MGHFDVLFLTDDVSKSDVTCGGSPSITVRIDELRAIDAPVSAIRCDVNLRDLVSIERLRSALLLYRIDASIPLIFRIHPTNAAAYAIANALGATSIVSEDTSLATYGAVPIPRQPDSSDEPTPALPPVEVQVGKVASALQKMFGAAARNEGFSAANMSDGADALMMAVKQTNIRDLVGIVRGYDDATYQHCLLVAGLVASFAARLGLSFKSQQLLSQAALVHDIGKARVPHAILNKAGALSPAEMEVMRKHPATGYYMIAYQKGIDPNILDVVRHHHEYLDGSGYPDRLRGEEISEFCRISTICDIYAALIEKRAYKEPRPPHEAYAILVEMGKKLDARLVQEFRGLVDEMSDSADMAA